MTGPTAHMPRTSTHRSAHPLRSTALLPIAALLLLASGCAGSLERTFTTQPPAPPGTAVRGERIPTMKAHLRDGGVIVFSAWDTDADARRMTGRGIRYDASRTRHEEGAFDVPLDSVALFETNARTSDGATVAMGIVTAASLGLTAYCAANPKACFGSCPTFYMRDGEEERLLAEGFSSSVLPSLEAADVDALPLGKPSSGTVDVEMRNEAFETHAVRSVHLLAVPARAGTRVLQASSGGFLRVGRTAPPVTCVSRQGEVASLIAAMDDREYASPTDSADLAHPEELLLTFDARAHGAQASGAQTPGAQALVLGTRQSLVTTFLFYHMLALMGTRAGELLARMERGDHVMRAQFEAMRTKLGGIVVEVRTADGSWRRVAEIDEHGPLAADLRAVPLPEDMASPVQVRLRCAQGLWRFNWVALADVVEPCVPVRCEVREVLREGRPDPAALAALRDSTRHLVTGPGDTYVLRYSLPDVEAGYELLLESRGYYLEWMREEWLKDENPALAALLFSHPVAAYRMLAPMYKAQEAGMDDIFWRSRYAHP